MQVAIQQLQNSAARHITKRAIVRPFIAIPQSSLAQSQDELNSVGNYGKVTAADLRRHETTQVISLAIAAFLVCLVRPAGLNVVQDIEVR